MRLIGSWPSPLYGKVMAFETTYEAENGPIAVVLKCRSEHLATLSINMYKPECSQDSRDLPARCFYMKTWSENAKIAVEAAASGLFKRRADIPDAYFGFVFAQAWEILP